MGGSCDDENPTPLGDGSVSRIEFDDQAILVPVAGLPE